MSTCLSSFQPSTLGSPADQKHEAARLDVMKSPLWTADRREPFRKAVGAAILPHGAALASDFK